VIKPWQTRAPSREITCVTFRYKLRDEPPERLTGRRLLAVIEASQVVHGGPFLFSVSTDPEAEVKWIPADTPLAALVAALNDARPTLINSFASSLQELAAEALPVSGPPNTERRQDRCRHHRTGRHRSASPSADRRACQI
jgi:hypothetical protein